MSSHAVGSSSNNNDDAMDIDEESDFESSGISSQLDDEPPLATILQDSNDWLANIRSLPESEVIILLTPVVVPITQDIADVSDPFEPFGQSIARRHARVRHIPYIHRNGITSTHLGFIKRGNIIILCFVVRPEHQLQLEIAEIVFAVSDKPCIIMICGDYIDMHDPIPFPTVIRTTAYSVKALEMAAALIFGEIRPKLKGVLAATSGPRITEPVRPKLWPVDQWNEDRDLPSVRNLWMGNFDKRFAVDVKVLEHLLCREGYGKHYVVRDPGSEEILGFCATYLTYVDQEGEKLVASLAILLVKKTLRRQGIGLSLHAHALGQFRRTRGVIRLQLGSTIPRILHGPLLGASSELTTNNEWFSRRGWTLHKDLPGQGQPVYDLMLNFGSWRYQRPPEIFLCRPCTQDDMTRVLEMVEAASQQQSKMGWFDQYFSLMDGANVKDIMLCLAGETIIATALTYTPSCGSPIASNRPWAGRIGVDVGGVTCLCLFNPEQGHSIIRGLLNACIMKLHELGMTRMILDSVTKSYGVAELMDLGFVEWARYMDVWKDV